VHDISPDGQFVVYSSVASNLVADDTNGFEDIFLYDTVNDTTELVSVSDNEIQGNNESTQATVSDDGRYVCFTSRASNLVSGDGNAASDVFVRDRQDLLTIRVSISDGELQGNDASVIGKISGNGLVVAFQSVATNLVTGDTNGESDLFVRNISAATTTRVSVAENGGQSNMSLNGTNASISQDGTLVAFQSEDALVAGDINNFSSDVYLRNVSAGTTIRVSIGPSGEESDGFSNFPDISADGTLVVFSSRSMTFGSNPTPHTRIFLKNLTTGTIEHVSVSSSENAGFGDSDGPRISADGRFVAFSSLAPDLVSGDNNGENDFFVRDRLLGTTTRVSITSTGGQSASPPFYYFAKLFNISNNGTFAFDSTAIDLVPGDANGFADIYTGSVPTTLPPAVDNSALKAKYLADIKKLTKQIKTAKTKKQATTVKKLTKKLKAVKALLAAL